MKIKKIINFSNGEVFREVNFEFLFILIKLERINEVKEILEKIIS